MTIDPTTLPDGTPVQTCEGGRIVFLSHCGDRYALARCNVDTEAATWEWDDDERVTRVFVPVPDGMTLADAEAALADAGAWVEVKTLSKVPEGVRVRSEWKQWDETPEILYVHRDDLPPTDPDAELVEDLVSYLGDTFKLGHIDRARGLLAVVREHEATR